MTLLYHRQGLLLAVCNALLVGQLFLQRPSYAFSPSVSSTVHMESRCYWNEIRPTTLMLTSDESQDTSVESSKAKVRFSGIRSDKGETAMVSNPVDYVLSLLTSDVGSIAVGLVGLLLLLVGRLILDGDTQSSVEGLGAETRANLLAVFACGSVLLNGISKLDVDSVLAEAVVLNGEQVQDPIFVGHFANKELDTPRWIMSSLLSATPAKTAVILTRENDTWQLAGFVGVLPKVVIASRENSSISPIPQSTPIVDRFKSGGDKETYLPTLQALPGKTEFSYLPVNTQAVLILPMQNEGGQYALVMGSNQARSFTPRDIAWCQSLAARFSSA